jgi:hypothetical protein
MAEGKRRLSALMKRMTAERTLSDKKKDKQFAKGPTAKQAKECCEMLEAGCTLNEIGSLPDMPTPTQWRRAASRDAKLGARIDEARAHGAIAMLDDGREIADAMIREAVAEDNDLEHSTFMLRGADTVTRITAAMVKLYAPKRYGELIKHADADGNAITVNVESFSPAKTTAPGN